MTYNSKPHQPDNLVSYKVANELETETLASDLSIILSKGDIVAISGELGAGKSTFCRHIIRSIASEEIMDIPSPTFSLLQNYEFERINVAHLDLYRIENPYELLELGFEDFINDSVMLIEWAEKGENLIPEDSLWLRVTSGPSDTDREFSFLGNADIWKSRLDRTFEIREFLEKNGWNGSKRKFLQGDASTRQYETISRGNEKFVLMNASKAVKEPKVRHERTYSEIAHTTNSTESFVAVGELLENAGIRVPKIHAMDLESGLLLLEHLGNESIQRNGLPDEERYLAAVEVLARIHELEWPTEVRVGKKVNVEIPLFNLEIVQIEVEVFLDWYVSLERNQKVAASQRKRFLACWSELYEKLKNSEKSLVLRDYHSPNLLWQHRGTGTDRIGVLDFQDGLIGPSAYDLVSVVQDARVSISAGMQQNLTNHYISCRSESGTVLNGADFERDFAILAAQRATRIIGTFIRLAKRDGKPAYLGHIPRLIEYLQQNLQHPDLSDLKKCFTSEGWI